MLHDVVQVFFRRDESVCVVHVEIAELIVGQLAERRLHTGNQNVHPLLAYALLDELENGLPVPVLQALHIHHLVVLAQENPVPFFVFRQ